MEYITPDEIRALKVAYEKAVKDGREEFIYKGHTLLTDYAKYLIEYLEINNKNQD